MIVLNISVLKKVCSDIIVFFFISASAMKLQEILFTKCIGKLMNLRTQIGFHG